MTKATIAADRENRVYARGETAAFSIEVSGAKPGEAFTAAIHNHGPKIIAERKATANAQGVLEWESEMARRGGVDTAPQFPALRGALGEPGFMMCELKNAAGETIAADSAAVEPLGIRAGGARPEDFDQFWDGAVRRLAQSVPLDPAIKRSPQHDTPHSEAFRVSFATFGGRAHGFLSVPLKLRAPAPVEVNVPGAGPGATGPNTNLAERGFIQLVMNVHPYAPAADAEGQQKLCAEQDEDLRKRFGVPRYCHAGAAARESYFYFPAILGINRAVDWLAAREDVDLTRFYYNGTSQGGGFGLYLCALNRHFTRAAIHVPALCDPLGFRLGRFSGWPKTVESQPPETREAASETTPYFDAAHFAPRVKIPVRMSVGFVDLSCPPASVYAAYNALGSSDKQILDGVGMPHQVFPDFYKKINDGWLFA